MEFYENLLYLAKAAKLTNIDKSEAATDQFIEGLRSNSIKKQILVDERRGEH